MSKALQTIARWARLIFALPTRRPIRVAPGFWLQVPWGTTDRELANALRRALAEYESRKGNKQ